MFNPSPPRKSSFIQLIRQNGVFLLMLIPGAALLFIFNYMPMLGVLMSFKNMKFFSDNIFINFFQSEWVGFENFEFFFKTPDAWRITRNTVAYNLVFILLGPVVSVSLAILLNEVRGKFKGKFYQGAIMLPYFLSWVVASYIVYSFLNPQSGIINRMLLPAIGVEEINWYIEADAWPFILVFLNLWKYSGYNSVVYLAAIAGIDQEYYEAARIDGANRLEQIWYITLPHLIPVITILTILAVGRIARGDFGLFYFATSQLGRGAFKSVADVLYTYVYTTLMETGNLGMSSAASLYQSAVGFVMVLVSNSVVNKIEKNNALF
jgi:putative aldouronate transport system permease protein